MKLYVYETEIMEIVCVVTGETNAECENKARKYLGTDGYACTYSPAFGTTEGLIENKNAEEI